MIEFNHVSQKSFISQREIGVHTPNFEFAMRDILRQDPDVVLVGEMRDYETMAAAIQVADGDMVVGRAGRDVPIAADVELLGASLAGKREQGNGGGKHRATATEKGETSGEGGQALVHRVGG